MSSARAVLAKKTAVATRNDATTTPSQQPAQNPIPMPYVYKPWPLWDTLTSASKQPTVSTTTTTPAFLRSPDSKSTPGVATSAPTKDDDYKIVMVLDESGSMAQVKTNIVDAINDLIRQQKTIKERPTLFTLIKFSDYTRTVKQNVSFDDIDFINNSDYSPNGGTALYDAIGDTLEAYKAEKNVLVVIITDGEENVSRRYSKQDIVPKIEALKADTNKGWSFVYIGCDLATAKQGHSTGFDTSTNSCNYRTDSRVEMCGALGAVSKGIAMQRNCKVSGNSAGAVRGYGVFQDFLQNK